MGLVTEVEVRTRNIEHFAELLSEAEYESIQEHKRAMRDRLEGRVWWHANTTAVGGGVAEMLYQQIGYARGGGIDARWVVITGGPEFFRITKRLHHALHGSEGDGSPLGERERGVYEERLRENAVELDTRVRRRDIVTLHDPQTAGMAPHLLRSGTLVIWRCHVGTELQNEQTRLGWDFLRPYLEDVPGMIFSRPHYVPSFCKPERAFVIQPSIDVFSPKNEPLDEDSIRTILVHVGLVEGPPPADAHHRFERADGTPGRVERQADVVRLGRAPTWETPLIVQVSRWDPLKDPIGVIRGFAEFVSNGGTNGAELVLAGPNVTGVTDDPEGAVVFERVLEFWRALPHAVRARVHLASLPTHDVEENAVIVNALQRHAAVVVQKSLVEGFGLTVTEAMWKGCPVVASGVGGIQDQIEDGVSGILLRDPQDPDEFAAALHRLLDDPDFAARCGMAARQRAIERFLDSRALVKQAQVVEQLEETRERGSEPSAR